MIEGRIDCSDSSRLYVTSAAGERYAVSRSDVVDIDHPGIALIILGTVGTVLGGVLLVAARSKFGAGGDPNDELGLGAAALGIYAAAAFGVGIPLLIIGGHRYYRSVHAARLVEPVPGMHTSALLPRLTCAFCATAERDNPRSLALLTGARRSYVAGTDHGRPTIFSRAASPLVHAGAQR